VTVEWFSSFMPAGFEPKHVYVAGTVDQGGNVANAIRVLDIPLVLCSAHRLNTAVSWGLGISGTVPRAASKGRSPTCRNLALRNVLSRAAALVGVFSHAAGNNDLLHLLQLQQLRQIQSELEGVAQDAARIDSYFSSNLDGGAATGGAEGELLQESASEGIAGAGLDGGGGGEAGGGGSDGGGDGGSRGGGGGGASGGGSASGDSGSAGGGRSAQEVEAGGRIINLRSRNDTRWLGNEPMLATLTKLETPIGRFFQLPQVRR
jgi:hypothetical protein